MPAAEAARASPAPGRGPAGLGPAATVTQAGPGTVNSVASGLWLGQAQTQHPDVPVVQPPEQAVTVTVVTPPAARGSDADSRS